MYCARCGESNPAGSAYCAKCGSPVGPAPGKGTPNGRRCPMCGVVNRADALYCANCGARVVPVDELSDSDLDFLREAQAPGPKLSLDAQIALNNERQRELFATGEDKPLDPNLERLIATPPPESRPRSLFGGRLGGGGGGGVDLNWLDSLRGDEPARPGPAAAAAPAPAPPPAQPPTPEPPTPEPLAQAAPPPPAPAAPEEPPPRWAAWGAPAAPPPAPAPEPEPAPAGGLPDWLAQLRSSLPAEEEPAPAPAPPSSQAPPESAQGGLPDWLLGSESTASASPAPPAAAASSDLPAWMTPVAEPPVSTGPVEPALPDWLNMPAADAEQPPAASLPAWLNPDAPPAAPPPAVADSHLPAWLRPLAPNPPPPAPPAEPPPPVPAAEAPAPAPAKPALPDWFHQLGGPDEPDVPGPAQTFAPAPAPEPAAPPAPEPPAQEAPSALGDIELPSWLRAAGAAPPPPPAPAGGRKPFTGKLPEMEGADQAGAPAPEEALAGDALPAWMSNPEPPPLADHVAPPEATAEEAHPWTAGTPVVPAAPESAGGELPDWMDSLGGAPQAPAASKEAPAPVPPPAAEEFPSWMSGTPAPAPAAPAAGSDDLPSWMNELGGSAVVPPPPVPPPASTGDSGLPDWMSEIGAAQAQAPSPAAKEAPATQADGFPAWMSGTPVSAEPAPPASKEAPAAPTDGFPAWMSGTPLPATPAEGQAAAPGEQGAPPAEVPAAPAAGAAGSGGFLSEEDLPAWLRAIRAQPAPGTAPPEVPPAPTPVQPPEEEEMPAWLRALGNVEEELVPVEGLAGQTSAAGPPVRVIRARPPRAGAVAVFQQLLAPPAVAAPAPAARRNVITRVPLDRVLYLLLLAVVVGMWLLVPIDPETATLPETPAGQAFYDKLAAVPANKPVLLVYDWDATRYGEMHDLSRAVTRVVDGTGHTFATISTVPQGEGFAQRVTAEAIPVAATIGCPATGPYGTRFLHLGYRPGNEAGLAALATSNIADVQPYDFACYSPNRNMPLLAASPRLDQFGAIVLLTSEEPALQRWIEQVAAQIPTVPVLAALPEGMRTGAVPYLNVGTGNARLQSAVFGLAGAQELEARIGATGRTGASADDARRQLGRMIHTQSAALFFIALALIVAFVMGFYRWINRRSAS